MKYFVLAARSISPVKLLSPRVRDDSVSSSPTSVALGVPEVVADTMLRS